MHCYKVRLSRHGKLAKNPLSLDFLELQDSGSGVDAEAPGISSWSLKGILTGCGGGFSGIAVDVGVWQWFGVSNRL